jgi:hypothetical protein
MRTSRPPLGTLTSFQGKFDVKDFIGAFSEKLIAQSKADPGRVLKDPSCYSMYNDLTCFSFQSEAVHQYIRGRC